jgi:hypothetical protein
VTSRKGDLSLLSGLQTTKLPSAAKIMNTSRAKSAFSILQEHIMRNYEGRPFPDGTPLEKWCSLPEIPSKAEIMPKLDNDRRQNCEEWNDYQKDPVYDPDLPVNIVDQPWPSKMGYLGAHYQILREDAIAPLRKSVDYFRSHQQRGDNEDTYVYNDVSEVLSTLAEPG